MYVFIVISCLLFAGGSNAGNIEPDAVTIACDNSTALSILFPKNNQKVRGEYKIYGKAKPGSVVQLHITSSYYKTARDHRQRISKGAGPVNRMNRKYSITADRRGNWTLKNIELLNAGWEESFTIKATADKKTVSIQVYDNTHPIAID